MRNAEILVVLYANPDWYPPTHAAVSLLAERFAVRIVCRDVDDASLVWPASVELVRVGEHSTSLARERRGRGAKLRELSRFVVAVRGALRRRPAVVFAYEPHALLALRLAGCTAPVVYHRHELEDARPPRSSVPGLAQVLSRHVGLVTLPDPQRAAHYAALAALPSPPLVVPNFPLLRSFPAPPDLGAQIEARFARRLLMYRGSLGPDAGVLEAARALAVLSGVELQLYGPARPPFPEALLELAAFLGVAERVHCGGFVRSYTELNRLTQRGTVGLMLAHDTSVNTRFIGTATNKIYEYAACALPVVASRRFGDLLGEEPWVELADETSPDSIAQAVARCLSSAEQYASRARAARQAFEERFHFEIGFAPVLERVRQLCEEPR